MMLSLVLSVLLSAGVAALFVPLCQILAFRHVLRSPNALNVAGRPDPVRPDSADEPAKEDDSSFEPPVVPLSFGLLRGRGRETAVMAVVAALLAGVTMAVSPFLNGLAGWYASAYAVLWGMVTACIVVNAVTDWRHYVLPHMTNLMLLAGTLGMAILQPLGLAAAHSRTPGSVWLSVGTGLGLFILFFIMEQFGKSGGGDTKTIISFGFLLGGWVVLALCYSSVLAILYKLTIARWVESKKSVPEAESKSLLKQKVPYGPFLAGGLYLFLLTFTWNALLFKAYLTLAMH